jgi:hypothetical protein
MLVWLAEQEVGNMMNCPECGREVPDKPGTVSYSCGVPGCLAIRFCCNACILAHMGKHVRERDERIEALEEALDFYADPETYHAIAFWFDPPCGGFAEDFDEDHGGDYDRPMPGKLARVTLRRTE